MDGGIERIEKEEEENVSWKEEISILVNKKFYSFQNVSYGFFEILLGIYGLFISIDEITRVGLTYKNEYRLRLIY